MLRDEPVLQVDDDDRDERDAQQGGREALPRRGRRSGSRRPRARRWRARWPGSASDTGRRSRGSARAGRATTRTGTSSSGVSVRAHEVQCERGLTSDSPAGQREASTVEKEPSARPMRPGDGRPVGGGGAEEHQRTMNRS